MFKAILISMLCLLFCACATLPAPTSQLHYMSWQQRQQQLQTIQNFNISGTMSLAYAGQNSIMHFSWQQSPDNFTINLSSLIGIGGIKITGNKQQVTLWKSATEKVTAKTPEALMQSQLGWSMPIHDVRYWVIGLPAPDSPYKAKFDRYNHLSVLKQRGWVIQYIDWQVVNNVDLPRTILLTGPQLQAKITLSPQFSLKSYIF